MRLPEWQRGLTVSIEYRSVLVIEFFFSFRMIC
jgi:hypothetical protein